MTRGWLILDKPEGMTSARLVSIVKRKLKGVKVGHAGTLDPLASGILPLALGEGTKTVPYVMSSRKGYTFDLVWGEQRTTDDSEGEVMQTSSHRPTFHDIERILPSFTGNIQQMPPQYSAIKLEGKRAYDLARQGQEVSLQARTVHVESLRYLGEGEPDVGRFEVICGPGTYVRSLVRDMAQTLGTVGYARHIRRFMVGKFEEKDALLFEKLEMLTEKALIEEYVISLEAVLDDIPALPFSWEDVQRLLMGQRIPFPAMAGGATLKVEDDSVFLVLNPDKKGVALAKCVDAVVHPFKVLNV